MVSQLLIIIGFWAYYHVNHPLGNLLTGDIVGKLLAWGRMAGLLAAFAILFQLMLIGRVRWLEQSFGMDRLTRLHHMVGFFLVALLVAHPILLDFGHSMQAGITPRAQHLDFLKTWEDVLAAQIGFDLMILAVVISIFVLTKKLRYESWYATHLVLYLAFALAFGHQLAVGSDFTDNKWFKFYWCLLYAFVLLSLVTCRFIKPMNAFLRHRFVVTKLVPEAGDVTSIYIEGKNMETFPVKAGQFMIVRFLAEGFRWEAHPFSMSWLPDGKQLRLTIKRLGDFTRRIPDLKPGTPVLIDGPHGIFTSAGCSSSKILMIAGGIGITPIRSLAEEMITAGRDVILIYGNRNSPSIVFRKELDDIAARAGGRLKIFHVMSDDPAWQGEKGRVDRDLIARLVPDLSERDVFLCGPPVMMKLIRATLAGMGVSSSRIHYERFSL